MQNRTKIKNATLMLEMPISRLIPQMAVPTIVAQLITTIYNLADTYFVSSLGTNATAAVGVNSSLEHAITLIGTLIGGGACSYIARLLGAKEDEEADKVLSTSFLTGLGMGLILTVAGLVSINHLVYWLGATEDCANYSIQYAQYVLCAAPFMISSLILNMCLRSEGSSRRAMIGIGFGGVLNCILDPIFIFGLDLGVAGASMATAISKVVSFCILMYPYIRKQCSVQIALKYFGYTKVMVKEVLSIGSTGFFRSGLGVVASILMNRVAGEFSTSVLAAISVANRVMMFPFAIILGFGQGYQPVAGFNWGAKKYQRVKESLRFGSIVSIVGAIVIGLVIFVFAKPIVGIFNKKADADVLRIGMFCIRMQCIALPVHAWVSIINMFFGGVGDAKKALLMCTARQGYCLIPLLLIVPHFLGEYGLASCQAMADGVTLFIALPMAMAAFRLVNDAIQKQQEEAGVVEQKATDIKT